MAFLVVLCLLFASAAHAGPITASASGCVSSLPAGASWVTTELTGFQFMAFYDSEAGCDPTIRGNTHGFHAITVSPDSYRVDVLAKLLPTCGRLQFDAHSYSATGLDPFGLTALVFDTKIDCAPKPGYPGSTAGLLPGYPGSQSGLLPLYGGTVTEIPPYTPPYVPPGGSPSSPVPVPDSSSSLWLFAAGLVLLRASRGSQGHAKCRAATKTEVIRW